MASFQEILTAAVADLSKHGFDSAERVAKWQEQLQKAAEVYAGVGRRAEEMLRESFAVIYRRLIEQGGILRYHPGVERYTLVKLAPHLRGELSRRIQLSANLIVLNKEEAIAKTLRRFSGWATSVPVGGSDIVDKVDVKKAVTKSIKVLPFVERRVIIDQGHKFRASLSEIVARDNKAIAARWHSHFKEAGYDFREDHKERDSKVYLVRGNWAQEKGLVKVGTDGYFEDVTAPGEEVNCRCWVTWVYSLRQLPEQMLTVKGKEALQRK